MPEPFCHWCSLLPQDGERKGKEKRRARGEGTKFRTRLLTNVRPLRPRQVLAKLSAPLPWEDTTTPGFQARHIKALLRATAGLHEDTLGKKMRKHVRYECRMPRATKTPQYEQGPSSTAGSCEGKRDQHQWLAELNVRTSRHVEVAPVDQASFVKTKRRCTLPGPPSPANIRIERTKDERTSS